MSADPVGDGEQTSSAPSEQSVETGTNGDDAVVLELPLHHRHASTVRVVAASLAADIGFSVDEIDDLRLGVDEAVSVVADVDAERSARLHLRFVLSTDSITVFVSRHGVAERVRRDQVDELAVRILRAVVDRFEVDDDGTFVVTKRLATHGG